MLKKKRKSTAYSWWFLLGLVGAHRYYMKNYKYGVFFTLYALISSKYQLTALIPVLAILWIIDAFLIPSRIDELNELQKEQIDSGTKEYIKKWVGTNPSSKQQLMLERHLHIFNYLSDYVLKTDEQVLKAIPAEYDKRKNTEIKGILVATDNRLIFAHVQN